VRNEDLTVEQSVPSSASSDINHFLLKEVSRLQEWRENTQNTVQTILEALLTSREAQQKLMEKIDRLEHELYSQKQKKQHSQPYKEEIVHLKTENDPSKLPITHLLSGSSYSVVSSCSADVFSSDPSSKLASSIVTTNIANTLTSSISTEMPSREITNSISKLGRSFLDTQFSSLLEDSNHPNDISNDNADSLDLLKIHSSKDSPSDSHEKVSPNPPQTLSEAPELFKWSENNGLILSQRSLIQSKESKSFEKIHENTNVWIENESKEEKPNSHHWINTIPSFPEQSIESYLSEEFIHDLDELAHLELTGSNFEDRSSSDILSGNEKDQSRPE